MNRVPHIAVINESTVVKDADVQAYVVAQQYQVAYHFKPYWGSGATLAIFAKGAPVPSTSWQLVILDDSDQAGALGYHDLTPAGLPLAKVFAKTDLIYGYNWMTTASHEILEMLADPWINTCVQVDSSTFYALEVSDACEADEYGYLVKGVMLSDFVLPEWFIPGSDGPWDYRHHITGALQLLPGGYIGEWRPSAGWTQKNASSAAHASRRLALRVAAHQEGPGLRRSER